MRIRIHERVRAHSRIDMCMRTFPHAFAFALPFALAFALAFAFPLASDRMHRADAYMRIGACMPSNAKTVATANAQALAQAQCAVRVSSYEYGRVCACTDIDICVYARMPADGVHLCACAECASF